MAEDENRGNRTGQSSRLANVGRFLADAGPFLAGVATLITAVLAVAAFLNDADGPPPTTRCTANIIVCAGKPMAVYAPQQPPPPVTVEKLESKYVRVEFDNSRVGTTGVALQFDPALNVKGFQFLEIAGTSTEEVTFIVEYKVTAGDEVKEVVDTPHQVFPKSPRNIKTVLVPIQYDDTVNEVVMNFVEKGQSADLFLRSISLK